MKVQKLSELPATYACKLCGEVKPIAEMCLVHTKGQFYLRPRCKSCHNTLEAGHRREYKRNYLRRWRKRNQKLNDSYWKRNDRARERNRINGAAYVAKHGEALAIQRRLRHKGERVTIEEAKALLEKFGRCYPTRYGLTKEGLRECERIRSTQRRHGRQRFTAFEIRLMAYEDGYFIDPSRQPVPYKSASENMRRWQQQQKQKPATPLPRVNSCATFRATSVAATA
jgi:hypothetical protein